MEHANTLNFRVAGLKFSVSSDATLSELQSLLPSYRTFYEKEATGDAPLFELFAHIAGEGEQPSQPAAQPLHTFDEPDIIQEFYAEPQGGHTIYIYISDDYEDVLAEGAWQQFFTERPEPLSCEEKKEWIAKNTGVALGSDAFFPFGDNIERAHKSGVAYVAQAGGSVRDDHVIETCNKYGIAMAFTGVRLFHH